MKKLKVNLGKGKTHEVVVGYGCLKNLSGFLKKIKPGTRAFVLTSPKIAGLHLEKLKEGLKGWKSSINYLPDGEKNKDFRRLPNFYRALVEFDRPGERIFIINFGGGVVGDFGGFLAASYKRGIEYIQIPTTLLACVDSGLGGKVAVNFEKLKNYIGFFHQPSFILADVSLLETLNKREYKSGLAEVIKYGIIADEKFFEKLEKNAEKILSRERKILEEIVFASYKIKAEVVEKDEKETKGVRTILNFGHTIGHAIESATNYALRHGEAISIGMVASCEIACKLGIFERNLKQRVENILKTFSLPTRMKKCSIEKILEPMAKDKKFTVAENRFVLPVKIGSVRVFERVPLSVIKNAIASLFHSS